MIRIVPACAADVDEIAAIEGRAFGDPWTRDSFDDVLAVGEAMYFACARDTADGRLAGYVVGWLVADHGEVANIAVDPVLRRQGIGTALLDAFLAEARARGVREVFLEVRSSNEAAKALYASRGFEQVGRRRGYYRHPVEDALVLRSQLGVPSMA